MLKTAKFLIMLNVIMGLAVFVVSTPAFAQGFSGSDIGSYYCPRKENLTPITDANGDGLADVEVVNGNFICRYSVSNGGGTQTINALPRPPQLVQVQVWFIRIIYVLWGLSGVFFTLVLIYIGFLYMTSFGNDKQLSNVIKRFRNWMIGFVLVFLAYPILNTFFRVLNVEPNVCYTELSLPAFQFFFPNACTPSALNTFTELPAGCRCVGDITGSTSSPACPSNYDSITVTSDVCGAWPPFSTSACCPI